MARVTRQQWLAARTLHQTAERLSKEATSGAPDADIWVRMRAIEAAREQYRQSHEQILADAEDVFGPQKIVDHTSKRVQRVQRILVPRRKDRS